MILKYSNIWEIQVKMQILDTFSETGNYGSLCSYFLITATLSLKTSTALFVAS